MVQLVVDEQVIQLLGHETQAPLDRRVVAAQEVQTEADVQVKQLVEQAWHAVPLSN